MRFDWYAATIPARPEILVEGIREGVAEVVTVDRVERTKGTNNYEHADTLFDFTDQRICAVLHGGSNGAPHVRSSGHYSPTVAQVLRTRWPGHALSRADVAIDFDGPGCWPKLFRVCEDVARDRGLKWATYGDFREDRDPMSGRTVYVGSRQSAVMTRLYEKGLKELSTVRVGDPPISLDWCRLEVEVKPQQRAARVAASQWAPHQFWGCSTWSRSLLKRAIGADVERITMSIHKETDAVRAIRHMAMQYRQAMETVIADKGGDAAFMNLVRAIWREADGQQRAA